MTEINPSNRLNQSKPLKKAKPADNNKIPPPGKLTNSKNNDQGDQVIKGALQGKNIKKQAPEQRNIINNFNNLSFTEDKQLLKDMERYSSKGKIIETSKKTKSSVKKKVEANEVINKVVDKLEIAYKRKPVTDMTEATINYFLKPGFPPDLKKRLIEKFNRLNAAKSDKEVKSIVLEIEREVKGNEDVVDPFIQVYVYKRELAKTDIEGKVDAVYAAQYEQAHESLHESVDRLNKELQDSIKESDTKLLKDFYNMLAVYDGVEGDDPFPSTKSFDIRQLETNFKSVERAKTRHESHISELDKNRAQYLEKETIKKQGYKADVSKIDQNILHMEKLKQEISFDFKKSVINFPNKEDARARLRDRYPGISEEEIDSELKKDVSRAVLQLRSEDRDFSNRFDKSVKNWKTRQKAKETKPLKTQTKDSQEKASAARDREVLTTAQKNKKRRINSFIDAEEKRIRDLSDEEIKSDHISRLKINDNQSKEAGRVRLKRLNPDKSTAEIELILREDIRKAQAKVLGEDIEVAAILAKRNKVKPKKSLVKVASHKIKVSGDKMERDSELAERIKEKKINEAIWKRVTKTKK